MAAISEARPASVRPTMTAKPAWKPATLARPARRPWRRLLATISVTDGPGAIITTTVAARKVSQVESGMGVRGGG